MLQLRRHFGAAGSKEIKAELMQEAIEGVQDFRYGIAKISQSLRNLAMHSFLL